MSSRASSIVANGRRVVELMPISLANARTHRLGVWHESGASRKSPRTGTFGTTYDYRPSAQCSGGSQFGSLIRRERISSGPNSATRMSSAAACG